MPFASGIIPNFINGVSQQPAAVRLPTQLDIQVNGHSTITEGLRKRPPTVHQALLSGFPTSYAKYHTINRDATERYKVAMTDRDVDVVTLAGAAKTVNFATALFESLNIVTRSLKSIVENDGSGTNGTATSALVLPTGLTTMAVVTTITSGTVTILIQESILGTFADATTAATITTATTTAVTVVSGRYYRARISATTGSGPWTATLSWPEALEGNGIGRKIVTPTGTTLFDLITAGTFTGTILLQESILGDFTDATTAATVTTATTTAVTIVSGRYYRAKATAWTGTTAGTVTATFSWKDCAYINSSDPAADLKLITVADYTFILNKTITMASLVSKSPKRNPEALVHIVAGNYDQTYKVLINDVVQAEYNTAEADVAVDGVALTVIPANIAKALAWGTTSPNGFYAESYNGATVTANIGTAQVHDDLESFLTVKAGWTLARYSNVIHIENVNGVDFTISAEGNTSVGGINSIRVHKGSQREFSELPVNGPPGFKIKVIGDKTTDFDDYYVEFTAADAGGDRGYWKEAIKADEYTSLDPGTMPHALIRNADGTFTYGALSWEDRLVGDTELTPWPTFIGGAASDMVFFRNRLGVVVDENTCLSRAGSFFDHFPTTVTAQLDTDPIDVAISHPKVSTINHAVTYAEQLILFSGLTQFRLSGDELMTPKTANIRPLTEYRSDPDVEPIVCGSSVFFAVDNAQSTTIREYIYDDQNGVKDGPSITDHCNRFLPASIGQIAGNGHLNMIAMLTPSHPSRVYVYKFYWSGTEKLQSSWSYWDLGVGATILDVAFIDNDMSLVVSRSADTSIEAIPCEEGFRDTAPDLIVHLDRRVTLASCSKVYSAGTGNTTITLPYAASGVTIVTTAGVKLPTVSTSLMTAVVAGDQSAATGWAGFTYESRWRLSEFIPRERSRGDYADADPLPQGRLVVKYLTLTAGTTGYFTVEVGQSYRDTYTHTFTGALLGDADNLVGAPAFAWRSWRIPIMVPSDEVAIEIVNDSYLPLAVLNGEWEGEIYKRRK